MKHLDELTLLRMVDGELSSERHSSTRTHIVDCAPCQAGYESLKTETELLRATLREDEEPLPEAFRAQGGLFWFLAATLVLAGLGVSQFWSSVVDPMLRGMDRVGIDGQSLFTTVVIRGLLFRGWTNMVSTLTQLALWLSLLVALGTLALFAWRRIRTAALAMSLLAVLAALPGGAEAAVIELDRDTYVLPAGQTIDNDLIVAGEIVRIEGTVNGDLIVAARLVEVSGSITGDILGFAEEIDVTGTVAGNVRTASRSLDIEGIVEGNVTAAGEILRVGPGAQVQGSFTAAGKKTILAGPVERDLLIAAQTHQIDSRVGGSALLAGEELAIGDGAVVEGAIKFYGEREPEVSPAAKLASPVSFEPVEEDEEGGSRLSWLAHFVYFWAAAFVLGAAFVLIGPGAAEAITAVHMPQHAKSLLVGLLAVGAVAALAFGLMITLVGLPLGLVTLFFWILGLYVAQVYAGLYIGREILGRPTDRSQLLVRLAVGLLAIHIGKSVPYVGHLVTLAVALWGFGALTLFFLDSLTRMTPAAPPAVPAPEPV
ncbi:MAG TPA: polymer-forming cytoskeletal protein [Vicinamibacteria bacterium]|nr:polymer-forming cytoskeletal protein [Vicinamibacteria bacterium]